MRISLRDARRGIIAISLAAAGAALAQSPRSAAPPTYQAGIDALDYDITMELPDTGAFIHGDVVVTLRRSLGVRRVRLDLVDGLMVSAVEVNGARVAAPHQAGKVDVPLDVAGDSAQVRVVYEGAVTDGLVVQKDARGRWTWFGDNWPDRARQWLPTIDHPSDKATVSWRVIAAPSQTVVANGALVSTRRVRVRGAERKETSWRESRPIATYLMVIAVGPLERYDVREPDCHYGDAGQCVRQQVYVLPENRHWLPGVFSSVGPIVSLFERLVGPFPYEKLSHLQSSTRYGGMENASAIFYDGRLFPEEKVTDGLIAHETAHQWFGDAVTEREWGHLWLSEGFATYFAALWTQHIRGDAAFRAEMDRIREQILRDSVVAQRPVIDSAERDYMKLLNTNSYQKGGYVLYMLHQQIGDSAFFGALRSYYATYRHGTALSDDLRRELEKTSGRSLGQYFDQWLRRPGVATPTIGWSRDPSSGVVSLLVLQQDARGPFELPLSLAITRGDGTIARLTVTIPAQARAVVPLPETFTSQPRAIAFDPDTRLLARIAAL